MAPERFGERERLINELYSHQVSEIGSSDTFGTTGDDKRSRLARFANRQPRIGIVLEDIFGKKLLRIILLVGVLLGAARILGSPYLFLPLVLAVAALYCLSEDTEASRKLFVLIMSRMRVVRPRSS